ncbi:MAG: glycosyltransferase family 4 protein [Micrococcales bacterium]|nr:glycosyltransferase family 4 protein [Micrococcales bacterium]
MSGTVATVDQIAPEFLAAWCARLPIVTRALGCTAVAVSSVKSLTVALDQAINVTNHQDVWLALTVLSGRLPDEQIVIETSRRASLDGCSHMIRALRALTTTESIRWDVRVSRDDEVLTDAGDTVYNPSQSGIQRVVRRLAAQWRNRLDVTFVAWVSGLVSMRELSDPEERRLFDADLPLPVRTDDGATVVVPWRGTYLLPELAAEPDRANRLRAVAQFSRIRTVALGYDCIPLTTSETVQPGMSAGFASYLTALRHFDAIVTDSMAAAVEFGGWARALHAIGLVGPTISPAPLAVEVPETPQWVLHESCQRFQVAGMPLVLVVGSHEPRKNHLAVLHAAERLWVQGAVFNLVFVGGNAWQSERFADEIHSLRVRGRQVEAVRDLPDALLWAIYRLARFTVFPSFNEGFGLPVAESLAVGTPVITSRFGSMAEIAAGGGALVVDPRDEDDLTRAMARLLTDDLLLERLRHEARGRDPRSWQQYADDVWSLTVGG